MTLLFWFLGTQMYLRDIKVPTYIPPFGKEPTDSSRIVIFLHMYILNLSTVLYIEKKGAQTIIERIFFGKGGSK